MDVIQAVLCIAIGGWLTFELVRALRTGVGRGRYLSFNRRQDPAPYWLIVALQGGLAVACFWLAVHAVRSVLR
jgi:hypothetical protein